MAIYGPVVDTAPELRSLGSSQRAGAGAIRVLVDPMGDFSIPPALYLHIPGRTDPDAPPNIYAPDDNAGRWIQATKVSATWIVGDTAPSGSTGNVNDLYLNRLTGEYYLKTGASAWTLQGDLSLPGSSWLTGSGVPAGGLGLTGDFYLRSNGDFYEKTGTTTWTLRGSLIGPPGPEGPPNSLAIGSVTTGAAGSPASASITGDAPSQTLNLTIPQGSAGPAGPTGAVTAASALVLQEQSSDPTTGADELDIYNLSNELWWRGESNGTPRQVAATNRRQQFTQAQRSNVVALADGATVAIDAAASNMFTLTIAASRTLANPSNLAIGDNFVIRVTASTNTLTLGSAYQLVTGAAARTGNFILQCYCWDGVNLDVFCVAR